MGIVARIQADLAALGLMTEPMIGQDAGEHGLDNGHGTDADAGIVAPFGDNFRVLALNRDGLSGAED